MRRKLTVQCALVGATLLVGALAAPPPAAEGQRGLRAQVFLTQQRIPRNLSERQLVAFARRANARTLRETTDRPLPERKWTAEMVTSFNRPPGDLEFHVLWYDIEGGARRFVRDMSTYVSDREQATFVTRINLPRGQGRAEGFQPNRRYEAVVTVRRQEVGRMQVTLAGEEIARSGEVSFSDDER
jgi:hypothetical protein